jgi:putative transposase
VYPTDVTDKQWEEIEPIILKAKKKPATASTVKYGDRLMLNAILYANKTGCQWRMLPKEFPNFRRVHFRLQYWIKLGIFEEIQKMLLKKQEK